MLPTQRVGVLNQNINKLKLAFGACEQAPFKVNDVPPINIKDIIISEKGRVLHHWPLNEIKGTVVQDIINNKTAVVKNPEWIKAFYENWANIFQDTLRGPVFAAYNERNEEIYLIGNEYITTFSLSGKEVNILRYKNKPSNFTQDCQAFFDVSQNRLVCYSIKQKTISIFSFRSLEWKEVRFGSKIGTSFWHHNKHYFPSDSSFLIFGGYGQYEYKNIVQRYSFPSNIWDTLKTTGESFYPRYLSSLGINNDTIYLLGGHGSKSGKQIDNPQNFYTLMAYAVRGKTFFKKYDFISPIEDAVFANSMVIDREHNIFYALAFPIFKHQNYLQLVQGSLHKSGMKLAGNSIPYSFQDEKSFADLYYSNQMRKLFAITLYFTKEDNITFVSIFSISTPPNVILVNESKKISFLNKNAIWISIIFIIAALMIYVWFYKRKFKRNTKNTQVITTNSEPSADSQIKIIQENHSFKNAILFIGGFKVFNRNSIDITSKFSPLIKEIFLYIWLHSLKNHIGVSTEKLTELFWYNMSEKKAINNRSVNIAKLKGLLEELDACTLSRENGPWKIIFDDKIIYNDYWSCLKKTSSREHLTKDEALDLINIIDKGPFLESMEYEWLDEFKGNLANLIIDKLLNYGLSCEIAEDPDLILHLANAIFNFDIINEEAIILKCKALIAKGKHSLAKNAFSKFTKDYEVLYSTPFVKSFSEIIK